MVHGGMDRAAAFLKTVRRLGEGHVGPVEVTRYDRRGYARSLDPHDDPPPASIAAQVDDLLTVLDGQPSSVVGHSLGGVIALAAAEAAPELIGSVGAFEAPAPWLPTWPGRSAGAQALEVESQGPAEVAERFMRRLVGDEVWEGLPRSTQDQRRAEGPALIADLRSIRADPPYSTDRLVRDGTPIVVAHGTESRPHHIAGAEWLHASVERSGLVVIPGASHNAHHTHAAQFAAFAEEVVARAR